MLRKVLTIFIHHEFVYLTLFGNSFIICSASVFYWLEKDQNPNVSSIIDALWWAVVTMTTVGYGDIVPVTSLGRFVAFGTVMMGLVVIALFTGIIVRHFLTDVQK